MKKLILNFLVVSLVFLFACNEEESKQQVSFAPKVTEAKGYTVPKDSVSEPKTILAGIPIKVKAGQPIVNPTNLNVHIAGQPKIIVAGLPKINTPYMVYKILNTKSINMDFFILQLAKDFNTIFFMSERY